MHKNLERWLLSTILLSEVVIILGAYTRLTDAGLGCPDWPGCYGRLIAPSSSKAWTEMIHRYIAGTLGILIVLLSIKAWLLRKDSKLWMLITLVVGLVIFQALLGMWTVTLKLYPVVVMGHLLGGFAILSLLWLSYLLLRLKQMPNINISKSVKFLAYVALFVLCLQIALGGWTSANYAALVCADFPTCQGRWWPPMDWRAAFDLQAVGIFDSPGIPLENTPRVTIQMFHRIGALICSIILGTLAIILIRSKQNALPRLGVALLCFLALQLTLGITNVIAHLPLAISLLHNAIAACLLILILTILFTLNVKTKHIA